MDRNDGIHAVGATPTAISRRQLLAAAAVLGATAAGPATEAARPGQPPFDLDAVPLDDAAVFTMIAVGDVDGVFGLESPAMRDLLRRLRPDAFEDLVAAGALFRPGPMEGGMVDDFIAGKRGQRAIEYAHPRLEPILAGTHGVIVYQEQVMRVAADLAGYTPTDAEQLRRVLGRKQAAAVARERDLFIRGAVARGIDRDGAMRIFAELDTWTAYAFNRSYAVAHGLLTYRSAYLKCHFPGVPWLCSCRPPCANYLAPV